MPRIYTSANDPLDFCCHCCPKTEEQARKRYGNVGERLDGIASRLANLGADWTLDAVYGHVVGIREILEQALDAAEEEDR